MRDVIAPERKFGCAILEDSVVNETKGAITGRPFELTFNVHVTVREVAVCWTGAEI
jgi:hypothetical protein